MASEKRKYYKEVFEVLKLFFFSYVLLEDGKMKEIDVREKSIVEKIKKKFPQL